MLACELCGHPLIKTFDNTFMCKGCGCYYTKEEALKLLGNTALGSPSRPATPAPPSSQSAGFHIVAGILEKYTGTSTDVIIPGNVLSIRRDTFAGSGITSLYIPDGVSVRELHLEDCRWLKSIRLPADADLEFIGSKMFSGCAALEEIDIPEGVTRIADFAFAGCTALKRVSMPRSVKDLGMRAFSNCSSLAGIDLTHVEHVWNAAFCDCTRLQSVRMGPNTRLEKRQRDWAGHHFDNTPYGAMLQRKTDEHNAAVRAEAARKQEQQRQAYRSQNLCQHCGGAFKGFFSLTCTKCGKPKDY